MNCKHRSMSRSQTPEMVKHLPSSDKSARERKDDEQRLNASEKTNPMTRKCLWRAADPLRILVSLLVILILNKLFRLRALPITVLKTQDTEQVHQFNSTRLDPIAIYYGQKDLEPALQQSIMVHHNVLCGDLAELEKKPREALPSPPDFPVRISFRMNCEQLFSSNLYGTGNVLLMFYNIRLVARVVGNVEVQMECTDAMATRSRLVVPWLMGSFAATRPSPNNSSLNHPSLKDACDSFQPKTAHVIVDDIKYELRRMALSMVGVPHANHPAANFAVEESREKSLHVPMADSPLFPNVELDDVAIHFRCGDIIELRAHRKYHYARWISLAKRISPEARSIGIVTQPFNGQTRRIDRYNVGRCHQMVEPLQAYLQEKFPQAKVSLRDSPDETIALAFTRLIMANQSLAGGFSTFYIMPFHATFGTAYEIEEGEDTIPSEIIMKLWKSKNGLQQILDLFTSEDEKGIFGE